MDQGSLFSCPYCGGDPSEPNHVERCDGRQGGRPEPGAALAGVAGVVFSAIAILTATVRKTEEAKRRTSAIALYRNIDNGRIQRQMELIWNGLRYLGNATAGEVFEHLRSTGQWKSKGTGGHHNTCTRLTDLCDWGVVRRAGERPCRVTGEQCNSYAIVPAEEWLGVTTINRCPTCNQIVSRNVPVRVPPSDDGALN